MTFKVFFISMTFLKFQMEIELEICPIFKVSMNMSRCCEKKIENK